MTPITISFILPSLRAGGAERVVSTLAQKLDAEKFSVSIIVLGFEKDAKYKINNVNIIYLDKHRLVDSIGILFKTIYKLKPNIVMSSIGHVNQVMALFSFFFPKISFVAREASVISQISRFSNSKFKIPRFITAILYRRFNQVICQSEDMLQDLRFIYKIKEERITIVNNPVNLNYKLKQKILNSSNIPKFITIGRLSQEKGQERIINALSKLEVDFELTVIGTGHLRSSLKQLSSTLGLTNKIRFIDFSDEINNMLTESDVYLQGSFVEGFPNALLEACTSGIPVLAFNAPGGTKEIIEQGINGYIVNDETEFIEKLNLINSTKWNSEIIRNTVVKKFHPDSIVERYEQIFEKITQH
ncbi:glycosyltransferase [Maribacter sp. CXY002]|uniref:glycosyltransferase n=1 Tax=Maribacter luteocoastalis TaxID=3407671 RepID=UPI003B681186